MHFGTPTEHMKTCYTAVLKVQYSNLISKQFHTNV